MALEERVSKLEGAYEQVDRRLDDLNQNVTSLRAEFSSLRSEMNSRFNNMYVLIGGVWATLVAGFVALSLAVLNVN